MSDPIPSMPSAEPTPVTPSEDDAARSAPTGTSATTWIIIAVVVALIAGGVVLVVTRSDSTSSTIGDRPVQAQGPGQVRGMGARGTISSIRSATLTVDQADGTVMKVVTDSSTTVSITVDATLSQIAVGDQVTVVGVVAGSTVSAMQVTDMGNAADLQAQRQQQQQQRQPNPASDRTGGPGVTSPTDVTGNTVAPPPGGQGDGAVSAAGRFIMGEVTAVTATSLTMRTTDGTVYTVTLAADGKVSRTITGKVSDLQVGETVNVIGTTASDGTVTATRITSGIGAGAGFGGQGGPPGGLNGQGNGLGQGSSTTIAN